MKRITLRQLRRGTVFLLIFLLLFHWLQAVFVIKNSYGKYRSFRAQENVDILILGNSHAGDALGASVMEEDFRQTCGGEVSVFNYATYGMRMEQMYFFVREALKTHTPKLIILETYAFCPLAEEHREILARRAFDVWPLSLNKIEAIQYCVAEDHWSYYIPFIKYHTRWKELEEWDIAMLYDESLWSGAGKGAGTSSANICPDPGDGWFSQDTSQITATRALTDTEQECLERLLALLEEKDILLALVSVPFKEQMGLNSVEMVKINNYLRENYVDGEAVRLLDMNRLWAELDFGYDDLDNEGHVNASGAAKSMACLLQYLKEEYDIGAMAEYRQTA